MRLLPVTIAAFLMLLLSLCRLFGCGGGSFRPPGAPEDSVRALSYTAGELVELINPLLAPDGAQLQSLEFSEGHFLLTAEADCAQLQSLGMIPPDFPASDNQRCGLSGGLSGSGGAVSCSQLLLSCDELTLPLEGEYRAAFEAFVLSFCRSVSSGAGGVYESCELSDGLLTLTLSA